MAQRLTHDVYCTFSIVAIVAQRSLDLHVRMWDVCACVFVSVYVCHTENWRRSVSKPQPQRLSALCLFLHVAIFRICFSCNRSENSLKYYLIVVFEVSLEHLQGGSGICNNHTDSHTNLRIFCASYPFEMRSLIKSPASSELISHPQPEAGLSVAQIIIDDSPLISRLSTIHYILYWNIVY